jgi:metallophosphoesterase (TIGR00282 family)
VHAPGSAPRDLGKPVAGAGCPPIIEVHGPAPHGFRGPLIFFASDNFSRPMRILFIGDIVGSPGRELVIKNLAQIREDARADLVIANGENAASGFGITPKIADELFAAGVEVISGGNHSWDRKEIFDYIPHEPRLLRPANLPAGAPGRGMYLGETRTGARYAVLNLQGRVFMAALDCPFRTADQELARVPPDVKTIFVDMHAEATSEKQAMGWYLDGRVSVVVGTHTHVATADERVLPNGTAYITDVGMTGPHDSVIGMDRGAMVKRFLDALPAKFEVAVGDARLNGVVVDVDETNGRARSITRIRYPN